MSAFCMRACVRACDSTVPVLSYFFTVLYVHMYYVHRYIGTSTLCTHNRVGTYVLVTGNRPRSTS